MSENSLDEFWRRLDDRHTETDLKDALRERTKRDSQAIERLPEATVIAFIQRLLPDTISARAIAAFIDEHYDQQLGRADEKVGVAPRDELIPLGFDVLDDTAGTGGFAALGAQEQDELLARTERGELPGPGEFDSATWFKRVRGLALLGFGSDPRGMVFMGFPGPSYQTGHVWLDEGEVASRSRRRPGYRTL